ncbi:MAG: class I adenylate-forming enzyme family protein [Dehalococcoidia bacterium]
MTANPVFNLARDSIGNRAASPESGSRPAFTFISDEGVRSWTYAEAWAEIERYAQGLLARDLRPGERVLIRLAHSAEYAFAFFGANLAGLVPVPASPQLTEEEVDFLLSDSGASGVIARPAEWPSRASCPRFSPEELRHELRGMELPETHAEDPAYLIYTSGTTAKPKGVLHAQRVLIGRSFMVGDAWESLSASDVVMHAGALNWSYTMGVGLMDPWSVGARAILVASGTEPVSWPRLIEAHGVTVFAAVPTVYRQMLKYGRPEDHDLSRFRFGLCAGEALPPETAQMWRERVGTELYEALGMTECSTYISSGPGIPTKSGSPGKPQPGRRVAILSEETGGALPVDAVGLLAIHRSDPGLMLGYWRRPDEEAAVFRGEWFVGGDRASLDDDGYVWFHGRADDLIKSFGYRLSPIEIEAALSTCAGVAEVAVVGVPLDADKTLVTACIVAEDGVDLTDRELAEHAARHLAGYKRPHQYRFVDSFPRTANGKIRRSELVRDLLAEVR